MWLDSLELTVASGRGGDGMSSFRRELAVEYGGPNGGNGGPGGDVIVVASRDVKSIYHLKGRKKIAAGDGTRGREWDQTGASGEPFVMRVPLGTVIREAESGRVIADLVKEGESRVLLEGGRGGRGNAAFATATNRTPREKELGEEGRSLRIFIEVKLMADVGLVGLPNAGKSTLLSRLTAARPKIADYPFTTLEPMLGVVESRDEQFTIADLPGLIRGAHRGKGLGIQFLRHIERTRVLLHLIDATSEDPLGDYETIREELEAYGHGLAEKHSLVVFTKLDAIPDFVPPIKGAHAISAQSGKGLDALLHAVARKLTELPAVERLADEVTDASREMPVSVSRTADGFLIEGDAVRRYLARRPPEDMDGWRRFWKTLVRWGVAEELKALGVKEGDTVEVGGYELEYQDGE